MDFQKKERVLKKEPVFTRLGSTKWQKISKYGKKSQKEEINPMKKGRVVKVLKFFGLKG